MKKLIVTLILTICSLITYAQKTDKLENFARVNLGLQGAELSYELPIIQNKFLAEIGLGLGLGVRVNSNDAVNYTFILDRPSPSFKTTFKYIYNREHRTDRGRSNLNNAGSYVGLQAKYFLGNDDEFDYSSSLLTEVHWGFQTAMGKRFMFDFHIGLGYLNDFDFNRGTITPTLGVRFGYRLNK